jgi:hypothetical protein
MLRLASNKKIYTDMYGHKEVRQEDLLQYVFSDPIGEINGWTLRDLLELIRPYKDIFGEMAWCNLDAFYAELNKPIVKDPNGIVDHVEYIQVAFRAEIHKWAPDEISEYMDVVGRNDTYTDAAIEEDFKKNGTTDLGNRYAIEFTPVNELADLPIRIDDTYEIVKNLDEAPWRETLFKSRRPLYLLDVIWAILWEISFTGSPAERDEMSDELHKRLDEVKSGAAKTIPMEEAMKNMELHMEHLENLQSGPQGAD